MLPWSLYFWRINNTENLIARDKPPCTNVIVIAYDSYCLKLHLSKHVEIAWAIHNLQNIRFNVYIKLHFLQQNDYLFSLQIHTHILFLVVYCYNILLSIRSTPVSFRQLVKPATDKHWLLPILDLMNYLHSRPTNAQYSEEVFRKNVFTQSLCINKIVQS